MREHNKQTKKKGNKGDKKGPNSWQGDSLANLLKSIKYI